MYYVKEEEGLLSIESVTEETAKEMVQYETVEAAGKALDKISASLFELAESDAVVSRALEEGAKEERAAEERQAEGRLSPMSEASTLESVMRLLSTSVNEVTVALYRSGIDFYFLRDSLGWISGEVEMVTSEEELIELYKSKKDE